ncbi:MAG: electron transfer flavoprotein subunit beta/FixA family protein [Armatimonadota bacterium]|nr:electron transfer flavoprotein subunit beta/FixA family protein [Armatimonadota bacterium]MDR7447636.1 electron transfer flavoprotein subunit beta/FixA family protein [Armatimonadota bacterium]MDR7459483.1 electron transfer flavoprotein subunit beta/FixA family protein [Armatimonadota bacterium]MDR7480073.1 electron transfer flavoprotein subunit beta/FixA family protein [Armatimonadota bacterium]MDR7488796.1 electron transfer flavoprotein subunit beta/FixA family protein [Armatimonadota bact
MEIVVCIKQVPDTEAPIRIRPDGSGIDETGVNLVMNYYDEHATEAALQLRERFGGTVTLVSVGPERAREALRQGLAMGADEAVLVSDPRLARADHLQVARVLAAVIAPRRPDLVICGKLSTDDNAALVGPALAALLDLPQATAVSRLEVAEDATHALVHRELEGAVEVLELPLPALLTVERNLNEPRYPSLPGIMKAKRKEIPVLTLEAAGIDPEALGTPGAVLERLAPPPARPPGQRVDGQDPDAAVEAIVRYLAETAKVL